MWLPHRAANRTSGCTGRCLSTTRDPVIHTKAHSLQLYTEHTVSEKIALKKRLMLFCPFWVKSVHRGPTPLHSSLPSQIPYSPSQGLQKPATKVAWKSRTAESSPPNHLFQPPFSLASPGSLLCLTLAGLTPRGLACLSWLWPRVPFKDLKWNLANGPWPDAIPGCRKLDSVGLAEPSRFHLFVRRRWKPQRWEGPRAEGD